ncbi:MAG TPA: hypothetical protein DD412_04560 [Holosporales bacterium]|nr:hypothetical protein [Holosporales bacterium]
MSYCLLKALYLNFVLLLGSLMAVIPAQAKDVMVHVSNCTKLNLSITLYRCDTASCESPEGTLHGRTSNDFDVKADFLRAFTFK